MSGFSERYQKLKLRESLSRFYDYPSACDELSLILRRGFFKVPKNLQSIIFEDTLSAFRLLPEVHTERGKTAATRLLQAAVVALPKQKKVLAVAEFKHAVVAHRRRCKAQKDVEGPPQLPKDVLDHIFSFLDMQSLVVVGLVCRSWSIASNENQLWKSQYSTYFGSTLESTATSRPKEGSMNHETIFDWREAFRTAYSDKYPRGLRSNRGYCGLCKSIVWLSNMKCTNSHRALKSKDQQIKPTSSLQVVEYLLGESLSVTSPDSDSDSDEGSVYKLWAY